MSLILSFGVAGDFCAQRYIRGLYLNGSGEERAMWSFGLCAAKLTQPAHSPTSASGSPIWLSRGVGVIKPQCRWDSSIINIVSRICSGNSNKWRHTCEYNACWAVDGLGWWWRRPWVFGFLFLNRIGSISHAPPCPWQAQGYSFDYQGERRLECVVIGIYLKQK